MKAGEAILFVLTLPFTILTLGLFLVILNASMLWITDALYAACGSTASHHVRGGPDPLRPE